MSLRRLSLVSFLGFGASLAGTLAACEGGDGSGAQPGFDAGDTAPFDAGSSPFDAASKDDATVVDSGDAAGGSSITYSCGAFTEAPTWTVAPGFRAVIVAKDNGLNLPVGIAFAGGDFGGKLYVVNQGDNSLARVDTLTGAVDIFTTGGAWGTRKPVNLTAITWDAESVFDGALYVADAASTADQDDAIYRVTPTGVGSTFTAAPGPALDEVFSLAFAPKNSAYPQGLYATGDTDGPLPDWGVFGSNGVGTAFSEVAGAEGIVFANIPGFDGTLLASRPNGGGYAGEDEVSRIEANGAKGTALATGLAGVHAVTYSPTGVFGQNVYVASWNSGKVLRIDAAGTQTEVASGLTLTNYDANVLAISPDGRTMMVADRGANRIVCIEAAQ